MANVFANLPAPAGDGTGAAVDVSTMGKRRTFTIQDAFTGTVNVQFSNEGAAGPWVTALSFTQPDKKAIDIAARFMRVERSGAVQNNLGLPNVDVAANDNGGLFADLPATAADGTGATVDVSTFGTFKTVACTGPFSGTVIIEISEDNISFAECMTFTQAGWQAKAFTAQFMRVRRIGSAGLPAGTPNIDVGAINDATSGVVPSTIEWSVVGPFTAVGAPHALACGQLAQVNPTAGAFAVTLPAIGALNAGCPVTIKKIVGIATAVTVTPTGADTIDGEATFVMDGALDSITVVSDGASNWMVI